MRWIVGLLCALSADWWHLYRRLDQMRKGLVYLPSATDAEWQDRLRVEAAAIDHLRWTLWNGCECVYAADCAITELRLALEARAQGLLAAGRDVGRIQDMLDRLVDFRPFMYANAPSLINYNVARIDGERSLDGACRIHREFARQLAHE